MELTLTPAARLRAMFGFVCVVSILFEVHVLFVDRDDTFAIEGAQRYDITEFSDGRSVSQAFLMRGEGIRAVSVRLNSNVPASARLRWTLWRGFADEPPMMRAFEEESSLTVRPGGQWVTFNITRDGSSHNRWYTIQLQLLDAARAGPAPAAAPRVTLVASQDNPERGGVLWVNDVRQPGSLLMRADRRGRTLYRRFLTEAAPNLPAPFRSAPVQWLIVGVYHWAFLTFAFAVAIQGSRAARGGGSGTVTPADEQRL